MTHAYKKVAKPGMSQAEHTPGLLHLGFFTGNGYNVCCTDTGRVIAKVNARDEFDERARMDTARLAACWNACAGIPTEALECQTKKQLTEKLIAQRNTLAEALKKSSLALEDWIHTYASEMCDSAKVKRARERISDGGGTLHYVGMIQQENRAALAAVEKGEV